MSDEQAVIEPFKATIYVERKVNDGDYGSLTVGLHFPVELPAATADRSADIVASDVVIKEAFWIAKAHVFEQAGRKFEDKDGVLLEVIEKVFPNSQEVGAPRASTAAQTPAPADGGTPAVCAGCGGNEFYDNRPGIESGKSNPKSPHFKCKNKSCGKGVWPAR